MKRTGLAGLLFAVLAVPVAHADTDVVVRVEGQTQTLLSRTPVTLGTATEPNTGCPGDSSSAAIEQATKGNWDRQPYITTLLGESHDFSNSDAWFTWIFRGGVFKVGNGVCDQHLNARDELLVSYGVFGGPPDYTPVVYPLWLSDVPATVTAGVPFTVTVNRAACETASCAVGEGHRSAGAGATVTAGDVTATADVDGKATLTLTKPGATSLRATAAESNPSAAEAVTVAEAPVYSVPSGTLTPGPTTPADTTAPFSTIRGIQEQQVFRTRRKAPRTLRATVADDSSIAAVALSITRKLGKKCTAFNDTRGRFARVKCGKHPRFGVGSDAKVSFLLPKRLGAGRYVFDVVATDAAGNREQLARGRNRVVFRVR